MPQKAPWQPKDSKQLYRIFLLPLSQQFTIAHTQLVTLGAVVGTWLCWGLGVVRGRLSIDSQRVQKGKRSGRAEGEAIVRGGS